MSLGTVNGNKPAVKDYVPIRCVLEMNDHCELAVIVKPGCSVEDVHEMLRLLTMCRGHFKHLTFVDEDEYLP